MRYNIDDFELETFFSYTSVIPDNKTIVSLSVDMRDIYPNIIQEFETFYNILIDKAESITNKLLFNYFNDNKTVFRLRRKSDHAIFYIGRFDWRYKIGTGVYQSEGTQYDFITRTWSPKPVSDYRE